jgi:hypothetical protein
VETCVRPPKTPKAAQKNNMDQSLANHWARPHAAHLVKYDLHGHT